MRSPTVTFLLVLLFAAGAAARQEALSKELTALQGAWNIVSVNGQTVSEQGVALSLAFSGNRYTQTLNGQVVESGTVKLDASKKPITVEFSILEGDDAGKLQLGILEIGEETLRFAMNVAGATDRPATFEAGGSAGIFVMKKIK
jgi:uncharacterized protein (TIGR03067 family)